MKNILVMDEGFKEDKIAIGVINTSGEIEYTIYHRGDGGVIDSAHDTEDSVAAVMASEAGITEYQDYTLEPIE